MIFPSHCLIRVVASYGIRVADPLMKDPSRQSESPIPVANPSRRTESPIRIAARAQLQENVRKGREKGRELLMSVYAGVGTAVRCKYACQV